MITFQDDGLRYPTSPVTFGEKVTLHVVQHMLANVGHFLTAREVLIRCGILGLPRFAELTDTIESNRHVSEQIRNHAAMKSIQALLPKEKKMVEAERHHTLSVMTLYVRIATKQSRKPEHTRIIIRDLYEPFYNKAIQKEKYVTCPYAKLLFYVTEEAQKILDCLVRDLL